MASIIVLFSSLIKKTKIKRKKIITNQQRRMNDDERREGSKRIFMQHRRVNYESKNFHKNGAFVRSSEMRVEYNKEYMLEGRLHHLEFYSHQ